MKKHPFIPFIPFILTAAMLSAETAVCAQNCAPTFSCNLSATASTSSYPCAAGGNVTIHPVNGVAPFTYQWAPNVSSTNMASNLAPGTYSVTVTDASSGGIGPELVVNGDFSQGNTGFSSSYSACTQCCNTCLWPDATYAIGNNPNWYHSVFYGTDHTTGTGNMMIINGAATPNVSIWCQTISVTPNTNYVFSTWIAAMNMISAAQLQFEINGSSVGSIFAAPNQTYQWKQFCVVWNSGNNTTANICIINQSTVIYGNDFAIDDISFKAQTPCSTTVVVNITQSPGLLSSVASQNATCSGLNNGSAMVTVNAGTLPYTYSWNTTPVQNAATATGLSASNYSVLITDANGCTQTQSVSISQPPALLATATATPASCGASNGTGTAIASGGTSPYTYLWLSTPVQISATATGLAPGNYNLVVTDAGGCTQTQQVVVGLSGNFPTAAFLMSDDSLDFGNATVQFTDQSSGAYTWSWDFGDGYTSTQQHPQHSYSDTGTYCVTLIVRDQNGQCMDSTVQCLEIHGEFTFYIPNAFTPNGDWNNEVFFGKSQGVKKYSIWLFDRWGNMIWDCHYEGDAADWDQQDGLSSACRWDGKVVPGGMDMSGSGRQQVQEDVYVWKVKLIDIFNKPHSYVGHVSVIQ